MPSMIKPAAAIIRPQKKYFLALKLASRLILTKNWTYKSFQRPSYLPNWASVVCLGQWKRPKVGCLGPSRSLRQMRPRIFPQNQSPFFAVSDQRPTNQDQGSHIERPISEPPAIQASIRCRPLFTIVLCLQPISRKILRKTARQSLVRSF